MSDTAKQTSGSKKKTSFFRGLKKEFRKIVWPTKDDLVKETTAVAVISIILGVIIAILDFIIQIGVDKITTL